MKYTKEQLNTLGYNVRLLRSKLGLTIGELSNESGVSSTTISRIENAMDDGVRMITVCALARAFEVEYLELFKENCF